MTTAEVGAVALQELDLLFAENKGGIASRLFQAQLALGSRFQIVSQLGAANTADLEGTLDFVEGVSTVAHDVAGFGHVSELLGELGRDSFLLVLWDVVAILVPPR